MNQAEDRTEKRFKHFLVRVSILLGILILTPIVTMLILGPFRFGDGSEASLYSGGDDFVRILGDPAWIVNDQDDDGAVDCVVKVPATPWSKKGYSAPGATGRCAAEGLSPMPSSLREQLNELLAIKTVKLRWSHADLIDLNEDGEVDCVVLGTSRFAAEGRNCPNPAPDIQVMTDKMRLQASKALRLETVIRPQLMETL